MEESKNGGKSADQEDRNCILCLNEIKYFALGCCDHKNVCNTCSLRMRLILEDDQCPLCKTELDEIVISNDWSLTWSVFNKKVKRNCEEDPEDDTIYYHTDDARKASLTYRSLNCMIGNCPHHKQQFPNVASLQRHMETQHEKTFCKICLKGRTVFIREQRLYPTKMLRKHIEFGDMGDDRHGEILPHPYCDFCEEFFFNDLAFFNHLSREHLTCHLCGDHHKNVYYKSYENLEIHFKMTHHTCPYEICKAKCYVAFKTEDEL